MLIYETYLDMPQSSSMLAVLNMVCEWSKNHPMLKNLPSPKIELRNQHGVILSHIQCLTNPKVQEQIHSVCLYIPYGNDMPFDFVVNAVRAQNKLRIQLKLKQNDEQVAARQAKTDTKVLQTQHSDELKVAHEKFQREINELKQLHQAELNRKEKEITAKEKEIHDLNQLLEEHTQEMQHIDVMVQNRKAQTGQCLLIYGEEANLYEDEILSFVIEAISKMLRDNTHPNSRRQHILTDLLQHNLLPNDLRKEKAEALKQTMRHYRNLDAPTLNSLKKIGFSHSQEGTHHKFVFMGDQRYTATTSKSSSDNRTGQNFSHDVANKLF